MRLAAVIALLTAASAFAQNDDFILKAMKDEMQRSKTLRLPGLDAPYFVEYTVEDADILVVTATLGAFETLQHSPLRIQHVKVRVGDSNFDNTNYASPDSFRGARYDTEQLPLETNYLGLRHILWLATDREFKAAEETLARKKSALKNINLPDALPDFSKTETARALLPVPRLNVDEAAWKKRTVDLSAIFAAYPDIQNSNVEFQSVQSVNYLVNSEGTEIREPDNIAYFRIRAEAQASDGYPVRDTEVVKASDVNGLPSDAEQRHAVTQIAETVTALAHAPQGYAYDGPVLFEGRASAQLFGQLLGDNLKLLRKPVAEPGRQLQFLPSELETRVGTRILPDWMDIVDDPSQTEFGGQRLLGHYQYDLEGVAAKPVTLVEHGVLKDFLRTRTPALKGFESSNGHARLPGPHGADAPGFGNLFVRAAQTVSSADLKKKLIDLCKQRNKPYAILIRQLDWPSSASYEELRREMSGMSMSGGGGRPVSIPILVYRVYPDGKEELVRGVRFRGLSTRSFRDILAASDQPYVYNYMDSTAPFALMGAGAFVANSTIVAPSVLFEEVEMEQIMDETPSLPIVPSPPAN
ncbi:MAG: metallopeptidase TldD-related protein [Bryobacteraceae bacterium]